jgi:murein DD-endopeptidase MepM/ murein hydrolase activator NlpD
MKASSLSYLCLSVVFLLSAAVPSIAHAQSERPPLSLQLPLACQPNLNCWIAKYMDDDPGPDTLDYACGKRTSDGHKGTDFAIEDRRVMTEGVSVLAAADGTVARLRDGVADTKITAATRSSVEGIECGNGVVLRHGDDWETQYCHLRQGSIAVRVGDRVAAGQKLGLVGMSGLTEFPHVHLTVRYRGQNIDPFVGLSRASRCGPGQEPLWRSDLMPLLAYEPFAIYHAGFAGSIPTPDGVRAGEFDDSSLAASAPVLVLWVDIFGVVTDDVLSMRITSPDGAIMVEKRAVLSASQPLYFAFIGKRRHDVNWATGKYLGEIMLVRPRAVQGAFEKRVVRELNIR